MRSNIVCTRLAIALFPVLVPNVEGKDDPKPFDPMEERDRKAIGAHLEPRSYSSGRAVMHGFLGHAFYAVLQTMQP